MKATPEDVAKLKKSVTMSVDAEAASMKATPEDVAKNKRKQREVRVLVTPQ